jgi:alpha-beta hydrolase superfamily lysophospholipase
MRHPSPAPPALGEQDGLSYALFLPDGVPDVGVVVLHGAGSAKESHFDFARGCRDEGMAALAYDARGHGRSSGAFGPRAIDDALAMLELLAQHAPRVALRGSSLGGFQAIHAAARAGAEPAAGPLAPGASGAGAVAPAPGAAGAGAAAPAPAGAEARTPPCAVVAICPASEELLLRGLRSGRLLSFDCEVEACERWWRSSDVFAAAADLTPTTALMLLHARGDEQVPCQVSERLYAAAGEPKRLLLLPGGHHRSLQHDGEVQSLTRTFIERAAARRG